MTYNEVLKKLVDRQTKFAHRASWKKGQHEYKYKDKHIAIADECIYRDGSGFGVHVDEFVVITKPDSMGVKLFTPTEEDVIADDWCLGKIEDNTNG